MRPRPRKYDNVYRDGAVSLGPNENTNVLIKFLTTREVTLSKQVKASKLVIKPRKVGIYIRASNGAVQHRIEVMVMPSISPVDHTFRFYEPEQSHYSLVLPAFLQVNQPGLSVEISDPECKADLLGQTSHISISGLTENAMNMLPSTLFVWGDQFKAELLATCRVEVYSRPVIYTKARIGMKTQHSLALPALAARTIRVFSNKPNEVY